MTKKSKQPQSPFAKLITQKVNEIDTIVQDAKNVLDRISMCKEELLGYLKDKESNDGGN